MANISLTSKYGLVRQYDPIGEAYIFHMIPLKDSAHFFENEKCWCNPTDTRNDQLDQMGHSYKLWVHGDYIPKWG